MTRVTTIKGDFSPEYLDWRRLRSALEASGGDPASVFVRLDHLLEDESWKTLTNDDGALFESFSEFVRDRSKGLWMEPDELRKLLAVVGDTERKGTYGDLFDRVRTDVDRALRGEIPAARPPHRPTKDNVGATNVRDHANEADHILARLKRDDPALAEQVVNGDLSANAAASQKGWRKPRVLLTSPEHVASKLFDHWSGDQITELIELLQEGA